MNDLGLVLRRGSHLDAVRPDRRLGCLLDRSAVRLRLGLLDAVRRPDLDLPDVGRRPDRLQCRLDRSVVRLRLGLGPPDVGRPDLLDAVRLRLGRLDVDRLGLPDVGRLGRRLDCIVGRLVLGPRYCLDVGRLGRPAEPDAAAVKNYFVACQPYWLAVAHQIAQPPSELFLMVDWIVVVIVVLSYSYSPAVPEYFC